MRTKSGSYIKVSFFILNRFSLLILSFNSLGLSGNMSLIFLIITLPKYFFILGLMLNNWVKCKIML